MSFDIGFDFRGSSGFVTDNATWGVPVLGESTPTVYTAGSGDNITAQWMGGLNATDLVNTNDPRIAGVNSCLNIPSITRPFVIDLSSGSAPGPGTYLCDLALGDALSAQKQWFKLFDDTNLLLDLTNGGSGIATASGHFLDATGADIAATTTWTGTMALFTFTTNTVVLYMNPDGVDDGFASQTTIAHFRLIKQDTPAGGFIGSWIDSEVGRYVRGLTNQFDGTILKQWKDEAEAAAIAGPPYPFYLPELKRWFLDYFISIQP